MLHFGAIKMKCNMAMLVLDLWMSCKEFCLSLHFVAFMVVARFVDYSSCIATKLSISQVTDMKWWVVTINSTKEKTPRKPSTLKPWCNCALTVDNFVPHCFKHQQHRSYSRCVKQRTTIIRSVNQSWEMKLQVENEIVLVLLRKIVFLEGELENLFGLAANHETAVGTSDFLAAPIWRGFVYMF